MDPAGDSSGKTPGKPGPAGNDPSLWSLLAIGLQLTLSMSVAVVLGQWADARFGWAPWGTLCISMTTLALTLFLSLRNVLK